MTILAECLLVRNVTNFDEVFTRTANAVADVTMANMRVVRFYSDRYLPEKVCLLSISLIINEWWRFSCVNPIKPGSP